MWAAFEHFVIGRYLRGISGQVAGRGFLKMITLVAIGGVAVGVVALLLALSIVRGFSWEIEQKITGFGAHIQVESIQDAPITQADTVIQHLRQLPEVRNIYPVVQELALLRSSKDIEGVGVWGVETLTPYIRQHLIEGEALLEDEHGKTGALIGSHLARRLGLQVGDRVLVFSLRPQRQRTLFSPLRPRVRKFTIQGIYETGLTDFDDLYLFVPIHAARTLFNYPPDAVSRIDLEVTDPRYADSLAVRIEEELGFPFIARSIYEIYHNLFAWVRLQKSIIPLIIGVLILIAALNIVGILLMVVLEKSKEIGVLSSLGLSRRRVKRLFMLLGFWIGLIGTLLGEGMAFLLGSLQQRYAFIRLPQDIYFISSAPVLFRWEDFLLVMVVSLVLCTLAGYIPARVAARVEPVRVIRWAG